MVEDGFSLVRSADDDMVALREHRVLLGFPEHREAIRRVDMRAFRSTERHRI